MVKGFFSTCNRREVGGFDRKRGLLTFYATSFLSPREGRGGGEGHKCKKSILEIGKKSKQTLPSNNSGELLTDNNLFIIFNFVEKVLLYS